MTSVLSRTLLFAVFAVSPACGQAASSGGGSDSASVARALAGGDRWLTDFSRITVPPGEIVSGGPPKDGIPSIDSPKFESAAAADRWLEPREPVIVLELGDEVRAYPLRILMRHEIVNDEIAGQPVVVTYCPLCNTSLVFDGMVNGRRSDFGTTGRLRHSDLVMYDRQTETWWQQASGEAIVGELMGTVLDFLPANTVSWEMARELYPDLSVLSRDTGYGAAYGANPYVGYDTQRGPYAPFFSLQIDDRFPALDRVVAVDLGSGWAAPFSELSRTGVAEAEIDGAPFVAFWESGVASAVDARTVAGGRDIGASATYDRRVNDRTLTFERTDGRFVDRETESTWDFAGRAVSGPLTGERLTPIPHGNHFWFAWAAFRPGTEVWRAP
ncbi:MAG: DUF3179 domain-containing protein [Gemmatimonadota bacterium]|nr:DUF3179 domain-containing protein [Gemmatimonadota bacterium]